MERNQIVVCTAATAPKVKALSSRPNVAVMIDVGDTPTEAKALLVRRLASVDIIDDGIGPDQVTEFERQSGRRRSEISVIGTDRQGGGRRYRHRVQSLRQRGIAAPGPVQDPAGVLESIC